MLEPFIFLIELVLFEHKPRPWVVRLFRALGQLFKLPGQVLSQPPDLTPEALPVGTPSALFTASQQPPQRAPLPQFVNNSSWMQWEAARQHQIATSVAMMDTTMHRNSVLLDQPRGA